MSRWTLLAAAVSAALVAAAPAYAQEQSAQPGKVEMTVVPGGGLFFVGGSTESRFRNYSVGGAVAFKINDIVGLEGESNVAFGVYHQRLSAGSLSVMESPPNLVDLSGNMTFSIPGHRLVPYGVAGVGSLVLLTHTDLNVGASKLFLTGNAGGGLKWYSRGRWGLRADYRLVTVGSSDGAPEFFGREGRIAHRIYGGVILNLVE